MAPCCSKAAGAGGQPCARDPASLLQLARCLQQGARPEGNRRGLELQANAAWQLEIRISRGGGGRKNEVFLCGCFCSMVLPAQGLAMSCFRCYAMLQGHRLCFFGPIPILSHPTLRFSIRRYRFLVCKLGAWLATLGWMWLVAELIVATLALGLSVQRPCLFLLTKSSP